jgi:hypothetical protein
MGAEGHKKQEGRAEEHKKGGHYYRWCDLGEDIRTDLRNRQLVMMTKDI